MKTVLQEILEELKESKENSYYAMERNAIQDSIILVSSFLEKEKQHMIDAVLSCDKYGTQAEDYFNETFKQE